MESQEDDLALNIDSLMEDDYLSESENEYNIEPIPLYFLSNFPIEFGFFEQSSKNFYSIEKIGKAFFRIKQGLKILEVSFRINNTLQRYFYHLTNNFPTLIKIEKNCDIILHFKKPPKFSKDKEYEEPSDFLLKYLNEENNLICLDSPYRTILIPNCAKKILEQIYSQIFFIEKREILIDEINNYSLDQYLNNINNLKNKIDSITKGQFYDTYIIYANISETLQRHKFESVISIYENYKSDFKIEKYPSEKRQDKNMNDFYIMKHIAITPYSVKIKKESFHQSSRFLRLYFHNDNFIKIEFKDENDTQLYTNGPNTYSYTPNKIMTGMSKLYSKIFSEGFNLCGKKYKFFLNPTNCMRANSLWLLEQSEFQQKSEFYYRDLGLGNLLDKKNVSFSKLLARLSQNFTSSYGFKNKLNKDGFTWEIIDDIKNDKGDIYNDGCGMISYSLMKEICDLMNKGQFASAMQIRYKGAKGVLVVNPDIKEKKIILTKSMVKYKCINTEDLEVIRFSKYSSGYLNLQIIILLLLNGISKNKIFNIAKKEVSNYRNYKIVKDNLPIKNSEFDKVMDNIKKNNKILEKEKFYMSKIARSTYIYNRLSNISKKYRFHMKNCCFLLGVCDFHNILKENEIFVQIITDNNKKKVITGDILITKNPCLSVYDLQKVKGINNEFFSKYFFNVIVFPSKGKIPLPSKITGSDLDGDIYWVCWENSFLKQFKKRDYTNKVLVLKNEQEYPTKFEDKYTYNEKGERIKKYFIRVKTKNFNKLEQEKQGINFAEKCMNFHIFFHKNYKLPEINKNYLAYISDIFTNDKYKEEVDITKLEEYAFYHGVEVDFQKAGETSDFFGNLKQPSFLMKRIQQRNSNCLIKIKDIYDQYKKNILNAKKNLMICDDNINSIDVNNNNLDNIEDSNSTYSGSNHHRNYDLSNNNLNGEENNSFYDYFIKIGDNQINEFSHKYLKLFEKKRLINDMKENSFIYKIYELVSVFAPMQDSFLNMLHLISDEYFYEQNFQKNIFFFSEKVFKLEDNLIQEIFKKIVAINNYYENEIKYIMIENEIAIEIELIYLTDFIEPKISVFKNDIEDYKLNLNEQIKYAKKNSINKLESIRSEYNLTKNDIVNFLFIAVFWVTGFDICFGDIKDEEKNFDILEKEKKLRYINLDSIIYKKYRIRTKKEFIDNMVKEKGLDQIKSFYYENIKCISLYNFYTDFSCE